MHREKKLKKKKKEGFKLKTLWLTWKPWNFGNAYFHNFFLLLRLMWVYKTLDHMKTPCMLEFLFHWELYFIVLGDHVWKCLYASVHGLHSVKLCLKWKREYWYSMYNIFFFFFLKMFFSKSCSILFSGGKLFLQPLLFIVGDLIVCIPYVCHSYFAYVVPLISIASYFITFMLVHGFFVPLWSSLCFNGKVL